MGYSTRYRCTRLGLDITLARHVASHLLQPRAGRGYLHGGMIGTTLALPLVSIVFAILVAGLATGIFPQIADEAYRMLSS